MSRRIVVAVVALLVAAAPARAQLDPEPRTPYLWRSCSRPSRTRSSRRVPRSTQARLVAALAPALGPLGTVEVVDLDDVPRDKWDPLWQQFDDKGFPALDATPRPERREDALPDARVPATASTISNRASTTASPASPRRLSASRTCAAPELVGRTAGLMLDRDFGLAGTVEPGRARRGEGHRPRAGQLGSRRPVREGRRRLRGVAGEEDEPPAPPPVRTATGKIIAPPPVPRRRPACRPSRARFTLLRVTEVGRRRRVEVRGAHALEEPRSTGQTRRGRLPVHEARHGGRAAGGAPGQSRRGVAESPPGR